MSHCRAQGGDAASLRGTGSDLKKPYEECKARYRTSTGYDVPAELRAHRPTRTGQATLAIQPRPPSHKRNVFHANINTPHAPHARNHQYRVSISPSIASSPLRFFPLSHSPQPIIAPSSAGSGSLARQSTLSSASSSTTRAADPIRVVGADTTRTASLPT